MKTLVVLGLVLVVAYVMVFNPWNFFVPQSERFDLEEFRAIEKGSRLEDAVKALGEPTQVFPISMASCKSCRAIYFSGPPPDWIVGSLKAWLIVDENDVVVAQFSFNEP